MERINVVAKAGCTCPRERVGEAVITDTVPVEVRESMYYTRLLRDGSLLIWQPPKPAARKPAKQDKQEKPDKTGGEL